MEIRINNAINEAYSAKYGNVLEQIRNKEFSNLNELLDRLLIAYKKNVLKEQELYVFLDYFLQTDEDIESELNFVGKEVSELLSGFSS